MKKIILFAVLVFSTTLAMAQKSKTAGRTARTPAKGGNNGYYISDSLRPKQPAAATANARKSHNTNARATTAAGPKNNTWRSGDSLRGRKTPALRRQ